MTYLFIDLIKIDLLKNILKGMNELDLIDTLDYSMIKFFIILKFNVSVGPFFHSKSQLGLLLILCLNWVLIFEKLKQI